MCLIPKEMAQHSLLHKEVPWMLQSRAAGGSFPSSSQGRDPGASLNASPIKALFIWKVQRDATFTAPAHSYAMRPSSPQAARDSQAIERGEPAGVDAQTSTHPSGHGDADSGIG